MANISTNVLLLSFNVLFNLWLTPYLLRHLDLALYGFIPLATSIIGYIAIFTQGVNSAIGRFLTIDIAKGDISSANRTFNTALFSVVGISAVLLPIFLILCYLVPYLFNVPLGHANDVRWLFALSGIGFFIVAIASCFSVSAFCYSRFDLKNMVQFSYILVRGGVIIALFEAVSKRLWQMGAATIAAALATVAGNLLLWRKLTPQLSITYRYFERSRFRKMLGMGVWVTIYRVGGLLLINNDLLLVNLFWGAKIAGRYGIVFPLALLLRALGNSLAGVLTPKLIARWAKNDLNGMAHVLKKAIKIMGLGMAFPIGFLCGLSGPFLSIWVGPAYQGLQILLVVLIFHLCLNLASLPVFSVPVSFNKIRVPAIVTLIAGFVNLGLAIAVAKWSPWGPIGVAVVGGIVLTAKNTLFAPIYSAMIMKLPWHTFLSPLIPGLISTVLLAVVTFGVTQLYMPTGWLSFFAVCLVFLICSIPAMYFFALNKSDRNLIKSLLHYRLK